MYIELSGALHLGLTALGGMALGMGLMLLCYWRRRESKPLGVGSPSLGTEGALSFSL